MFCSPNFDQKVLQTSLRLFAYLTFFQRQLKTRNTDADKIVEEVQRLKQRSRAKEGLSQKTAGVKTEKREGEEEGEDTDVDEEEMAKKVMERLQEKKQNNQDNLSMGSDDDDDDDAGRLL